MKILSAAVGREKAHVIGTFGNRLDAYAGGEGHNCPTTVLRNDTSQYTDKQCGDEALLVGTLVIIALGELINGNPLASGVKGLDIYFPRVSCQPWPFSRRDGCT